MDREQVKEVLYQLVKDLKDYSVDLEILFFEMDDLSDDEFNKRSDEIQQKYSERHIELI